MKTTVSTKGRLILPASSEKQAHIEPGQDGPAHRPWVNWPPVPRPHRHTTRTISERQREGARPVRDHGSARSRDLLFVMRSVMRVGDVFFTGNAGPRNAGQRCISRREIREKRVRGLCFHGGKSGRAPWTARSSNERRPRGHRFDLGTKCVGTERKLTTRAHLEDARGHRHECLPAHHRTYAGPLGLPSCSRPEACGVARGNRLATPARRRMATSSDGPQHRTLPPFLLAPD